MASIVDIFLQHFLKERASLKHLNPWPCTRASPSLQSTPCWQNDRWDVEALWPQHASKGELVGLENQATITLFILHSDISGGHIGTRGKVTAAPGACREQRGKNIVWKLCSLISPWHADPSHFSSFSVSFMLASVVVLHPQLLWFFLSSTLVYQLHFPPPPLPVCCCLSRSSFLLPSSSSLISSHVSLPSSLPFFMCFWPRSHFPNWLRGSLIILRHPCCRLFYFFSCRHPNPLISKYPSSAHTASQQPMAFLYFFTVHTDGPSSSSRRAQHSTTLRAAQVKDRVENSSGILETENLLSLFSCPLGLRCIRLVVKCFEDMSVNSNLVIINKKHSAFCSNSITGRYEMVILFFNPLF